MNEIRMKCTEQGPHASHRFSEGIMGWCPGIFVPTKFPDVLAATRQFVSEDALGRWFSWAAHKGVIAVMKLSEPCDPKLGGQVIRALGKLADEGALIKVSRGDRRPGGGVAHHTTFYRPGAFEAEAEMAMAEGRSLADRRERLGHVFDTLHAYGFESQNPRGGEITLTVESWEALTRIVVGG